MDLIQEQQTNDLIMPFPEQYLAEIKFPYTRDIVIYLCENIEVFKDDRVRVTGPMESKIGIVVEVHFPLELPPHIHDRVISVLDTELFGDFHIVDHMWLTYDPKPLHKEKIRDWFISPYRHTPCVPVADFEPFHLYNIDTFPIYTIRSKRGREYFEEERVVYICIDKTTGYAIVEGSEYYEVHFAFNDEQITSMGCNCYCDGHCKHEYAVLLELECLIEDFMCTSDDEYVESQFLAAINRDVVWNMSVRNKWYTKISFPNEEMDDEDFEGIEIIY